MMSLWDALRMNMMISYQELVRTFLKVFTCASLREYAWKASAPELSRPLESMF